MHWWWWIIPGFVGVIGLAFALSGLGWMFRGRPFKGGRGVLGGGVFLAIGAIAAAKLGEDPTRFRSTIQFGITSIGVLNGIVGESALAKPFGE